MTSSVPSADSGAGPSWWTGQTQPLLVVAVGGGLGACARYAAGLLAPTASGTFPATTLVINLLGCAVMGVFMVWITARPRRHPLWRPFVGTGLLGGFTTFSTYELDAHDLIGGGQPSIALASLLITPVAAFAALWMAARIARRLVAPTSEDGAV